MKKLLLTLPILLGAACVGNTFAGNQQQVTAQLQGQITKVQSTALAAVKTAHDSLAKSIASNQATNQAAINSLKKQIQQLQLDQQNKINALQANIQQELKQLNDR